MKNISEYKNVFNFWKKVFAIIFIIFSLIYGISPVDAVPDVIPIFGWFDDLFLNLLAIIFAYFQWRKKHQ